MLRVMVPTERKGVAAVKPVKSCDSALLGATNRITTALHMFVSEVSNIPESRIVPAKIKKAAAKPAA
jgi:hypothetical protein